MPSLEEVWKEREEEIYPAFFGDRRQGIFVLTQDLFQNVFGEDDVDPRWLSYGIFEFEPTVDRTSWLYVSSAYSNPWEGPDATNDPEADSGSGIEFVFQSSVPGKWAIDFLARMLAFDLLLNHNRFPGKSPLSVGDRIPLRAPMKGDSSCLIRNAICARPEGIPTRFRLPSGNVQFIQFTGVTDDEASFAKDCGSPALIDRLRNAGFHPVTDPARTSLSIEVD